MILLQLEVSQESEVNCKTPPPLLVLIGKYQWGAVIDIRLIYD